MGEEQERTCRQKYIMTYRGEDLNLFCYSGSSFTKQSICSKLFISNLPFTLFGF